MAKETIYLCNFRVSVDGDWLCLEELNDIELDVTSQSANDNEGWSDKQSLKQSFTKQSATSASRNDL